MHRVGDAGSFDEHDRFGDCLVDVFVDQKLVVGIASLGGCDLIFGFGEPFLNQLFAFTLAIAQPTEEFVFARRQYKEPERIGDFGFDLFRAFDIDFEDDKSPT